MRNRMYGGVRGRKTKVGRKLLCFPPTRFMFIINFNWGFVFSLETVDRSLDHHFVDLFPTLGDGLYHFSCNLFHFFFPFFL